MTTFTGLRGVTPFQNAMRYVLTASVDVYRKSHTPDNSGGQVDTYARFTTYACHYEPAPVLPREREERSVLIQSATYWQFTLPHDADVRPTDRLVTSTQTFEVQGGGTSSLNIFTSVTALEIL